MKADNNLSRRRFLRNSALTSGFAAAGTLGLQAERSAGNPDIRLPREVWIAGISQMGLRTNTSEEMVTEMFRLMDRTMAFHPDIVCLPEVFHTSNVSKKYSVTEELSLAEKALPKFSEYARQNQCYVVCPVYTSESGKIYNAAVLFDREGVKVGEYRKIRLTEGEIENGLTPGPVSPPVFETDFGKVGVQICFDLMWDDGWARLQEKGAEVVFWPSAYGGGLVVESKAWQHKYVVASSTRKNTSRLCDITGEVITRTGIWDPGFYCGPVNLEKAFLHTWPFVRRFDEIRAKYGRKVRITNFHEEEWSIIESLSPEIKVADILKEFDLRTFVEHTRDAEVVQVKARGKL